MVRELVGLKARLTWNGVRSDVQRRFGLPIAAGLLTWVGWALARGHLDAASQLARDNPEALAGYMAWTALFGFLVWVALPVIIFPLDENLDPQQLALLPMGAYTMIGGLAAAALVAPSTVIPILLLGANGIALNNGWWMVLPASAVYLSLLIVGGQLFSATVSAILRTRRGRDVATFIVLGIAAGGFLIYRSVREAVDAMGLAGAALHVGITDWELLIPPVAAQGALVAAADGRIAYSLAALAAAATGLVVLTIAWKKVTHWLLTTPEQRAKPARRSRSTGFAAGPWGTVPTLARKELRFYVRDPRQRLVWTGAVIFVGLAVAGVIMNATGFFDIRGSAWAPLVAPILVLFVGLPIALNLFGWERNAASYLFVLPAKPHHLLLGKNMAVALALLVETVVLSLGLAFFTDQWSWMELLLPLTVSAIGCQLAVGNFVSVMTPLRLPREGTDVFAQSTEQGCLAIISQTVSFFTIGLLLVPPASVVVLTVEFGRAIPVWFAMVSTTLWGVALYAISLFISSRLLRRRVPEVLAWVQVV